MEETFSKIPLGNISPKEAANNQEFVYEYLRKVASDGIKYYTEQIHQEPKYLNDL